MYKEKEAIDILQRNGMKIDNDYLYISDSHKGIKRILRDTSWSTKWRDIFRRLPGAEEKSSCRFGQLTQRAIAIPRELIFTDEMEFGEKKSANEKNEKNENISLDND